jgi:acetyl-CoA/propionyl-CoA carboxylase biotin carboxyl carrier protein
VDGETSGLVEVDVTRADGGGRELAGEVRSPMPGTVIAVAVRVGDPVEKGQRVAVVEAMKMEYTLVATVAGTVVDVLAQVGDRVLVDALLVTVEPPVRP